MNEEVVNKIEETRKQNNVNWMNILKIALKYAPEETKEILREINKRDRKISILLSELAEKQ